MPGAGIDNSYSGSSSSDGSSPGGSSSDGSSPGGSSSDGSSPGGSSSDGSFEVVVEPRNDEYDPDDDGWRDQVAGLYADLDDSVDTARQSRPVAGAKGAVDQLIIAMGSAGVFTAAVDCLRAWLSRDKDRRIDLRWTENGVERSMTLTGEAVDTETIREIAKAAVDRVGGSSWPAGTAPS